MTVRWIYLGVAALPVNLTTSYNGAGEPVIAQNPNNIVVGAMANDIVWADGSAGFLRAWYARIPVSSF